MPSMSLSSELRTIIPESGSPSRCRPPAASSRPLKSIPTVSSTARENFKRAGVGHLITQVEGDAHQQVTKLTEPIGLVFIDADKEGYLDDLNKLLPLVRPGGLVIAHNIRVPP